MHIEQTSTPKETGKYILTFRGAMRIILVRLERKLQKRIIFYNMLANKPNLHYTRDITPKRATSGGAHLRGLA